MLQIDCKLNNLEDGTPINNLHENGLWQLQALLVDDSFQYCTNNPVILLFTLVISELRLA